MSLLEELVLVINPSEGTPKCVSSSKRASMTKAERLSAARRKKKADPGQQAAKNWCCKTNLCFN